jgi:micrococcal nuclease
MFKKLSLALLATVAALTLTACDTPEEKTDWDIIREIRDGITFDETELSDDLVLPVIENNDVTVTWVSSNPSFLSDDGVISKPDYYYNNQNASMTLTLQLGDAVLNMIYNFTVLAEDKPEVIELNTNETDNLALDFAYEDTDFIADGVGEASLVRCVDGDTAIFTEGGENFSVRFLGINTPESTAKFEPWGKTASDYTCDKLTNATTIVLQADPASGRLDSYGTRYLGWVWYDGRLLNLELVEQAFSKASGSTDTLYGSLIFDVNLRVQFSERRVWGEVDPIYDYSSEGLKITIEELVTNYLQYVGRKVVISGIVSRKLGGAAFIQQGDYGVYLYNRAWAPDLAVGNEVLLSGLTVTFYPDETTGALQVSDYKIYDGYSEVLSGDNAVTPKTISIPEITTEHVGSLLRVENLTVQSIYEGDDSFTITAVDSLGNTITVRKDAAVSEDIDVSLFQIGTQFTVVAPLSRYQSTFQLMITSLDDVIITE